MENNAQSPPDLQSILARLAQFAPPQAPRTPEGAGTVNVATPPSVYYTPKEELEPKPPLRPAATLTPKTVDPRLRPQSSSAIQSPKPIDPALITTWQDGLRCVTKIAVQNAEFAVSLRRMMQDQRAHEMRWYSERQNLKHVQANRSSSAARAQSILQSLGNGFSFSASTSEPEVDKEVELAEFDRKVYTAQQAMEIAMTAELKGLGVPFFGTDPSLIVPDGSNLSTATVSDHQAKWSPIITETQLLDLRRKMVGHLEDLYRD